MIVTVTIARITPRAGRPGWWIEYDDDTPRAVYLPADRVVPGRECVRTGARVQLCVNNDLTIVWAREPSYRAPLQCAAA